MKKATEPQHPNVAFKKVEICSGNNRPARDVKDDFQLPSNPLIARQYSAALALSLGPVEKLEEALSSGRRFIHPFSMKDMLEKLTGDDVLDVALWLRETAEWINTSDRAKAAEAICHFTFELVEKLNQLGDAGALRDAWGGIPAWPSNIARAGVGEKSNVVTRPESRAGIQHQKIDGADSSWRKWVEAACEAARFNQRYGVAFLKLMEVSKLETIWNIAPVRMHKKMPVKCYRTPGGRMFLWPWWLNDCFIVSEVLRPESLGAYKRVIEGILLWHLVFQRCMKDGAAMLGEVYDAPKAPPVTEAKWHKNGRVKERKHGAIGADYDPDVANKIKERMNRTLSALAGNTQKKTTT